MNNENKKLGFGVVVQMVVTAGMVCVSWGTLNARQVSVESRVSKIEAAIATMTEQRSHIEVLLGRLDEKLIAIQRQLSQHMKEMSSEP